MNEETDNNDILEVIDGTYIDNDMKLDTQVIPEFTDEEADNREYETIEKSEEGGL